MYIFPSLPTAHRVTKPCIHAVSEYMHSSFLFYSYAMHATWGTYNKHSLKLHAYQSSTMLVNHFDHAGDVHGCSAVKPWTSSWLTAACSWLASRASLLSTYFLQWQLTLGLPHDKLSSLPVPRLLYASCRDVCRPFWHHQIQIWRMQHAISACARYT